MNQTCQASSCCNCLSDARVVFISRDWRRLLPGGSDQRRHVLQRRAQRVADTLGLGDQVI